MVVEFKSGDQVEGQGDGQGFAATFEFLPKTEELPAEINSDSGRKTAINYRRFYSSTGKTITFISISHSDLSVELH